MQLHDLLQSELVIDVMITMMWRCDFLAGGADRTFPPKNGILVVNLKRDAGKVVPRAQKFVKGNLN